MCSFCRGLLLGLVVFLVSPVIQASSMKSMTLDEIAVNSRLIFEGRVIGTRVEQTAGSRSIHTIVTFEVMDQVKGNLERSTLELSFLGGAMGEIAMRVTEMHYPDMGERGIYFVENPGNRQVHPLYGWEQGHFIIQQDKQLQQAVVRTRKGPMVYGVDQGKMARIEALSNGVAQGIQMLPATAGSKPLTPEEFKAEIRRIVQ